MNLILIYFAFKYKGDFIGIYNALKNKEIVESSEIIDLEKKILKDNLKIITILDDEYPNSLKIISNPPFVLFYKGNISLLQKNSLCLVGDNETDIVINYINQAVKETSKNNVLTTNYFKGIEEKVVNFYLQNEKEIIFVSPNGLEDPYFANKISSSLSNLIISEYPVGVNINKKRLRERNRITAGLSDALIIFSSKRESGIINLVSNFLEQGKEIYCYPGIQDQSDGNNILIKDGANLITSINDIRNEKMN
ncbi:MAG: DNA-protecting protein DprA [Mycoplasmataceae bacterium]|nr:DNA-protecting protein DprA [Mycoplasmataceae bacterium]